MAQIKATRSKAAILFVVLLICKATNLFAQTPRALPISYDSLVRVSYVRSWDVVKPSTNANTVLIASDLTVGKMVTEYFDGLGRPLQTVTKLGSFPTSGTAVDLVEMSQYNIDGNEQFKYLPTGANNAGSNTSITDGKFKKNPFEQQASFYNSSNSGSPITGQSETYFYGENKFDITPLKRLTETSTPGNSWSGSMYKTVESDRKSVKTIYSYNSNTDGVRAWKVAIGAIGSFSTYSSTAYSAGKLEKIITTDESGKQVVQFIDQDGKLILKKVQLTASADLGAGSAHAGWLCTYFLYDDSGNLRCVIQPRGVEQIDPSWVLTDPTILAQQCYRYEYDQRDRMIMKKVPGTSTIYMVYDNRDRLVLTQNGNQTVAPIKWSYVQYDELNRPIATGLWTTTTTFASHISAAAAIPSSTVLNYPATGTSGLDEMTRTFYDNYDWRASYSNPLSATYSTSFDSYFQAVSNSTFPYPQANTQFLQTTGLVTGTRRKILGTSNYLFNINIYDSKGQLIQKYSQNATASTAVDITTTQYSWNGMPLTTIEQRQLIGSPNQTAIIVTQKTYDLLGRLNKTEKKISHTSVNGNVMSAFVPIANYEYNAIGKLKKKIIGSKKNPANNTYYSPRQPLQEQVYDYNIRGWLLGMNRDYLTTEGQTSDGKLFGFELGYDKLPNKSGENFNVATFNGNIMGMVWKSDGDDIRRKYDFSYDAANRLLKADFEQQNADDHFWNNSKINFAFKAGDGSNPLTAYDANGNIKRLQQWGVKLTTGVAQVDDLTYNYKDNQNSNVLLNVGDAFNDAQTKLGDFRVSALNPVQTKVASTVDYTYDLDGNLVKDLNKDLVTSAGGNGIVYNYLDLPETITIKKDASNNKGTVVNTYDATGNKLSKVVTEISSTLYGNRQVINTTKYVGGVTYGSFALSPVDPNIPNYTDRLQYIVQEEGRIRFKSENNTIEYDYFVRDHLGNVRMVLTEEVPTLYYPAATLEGTYTASGTDANSMINYEKKFYKLDNTKVTPEANITSWNPVTDPETIANLRLYYNNNGNPPSNLNYPAGCTPTQADGSTKLYRLKGNESRTGLEFMIKVMAGDKIDIHGTSYYVNTTDITNANSTPLDLLALMTTMLTAPANAAAVKGLTAAQLNTLNTGLVPGSFFRGANNEATTKVPKAYINYILFDEQFKCVGGDFSRVGASGSVKRHWIDDGTKLQNIPVLKNGYIFVYLSNESNFDVYFDNLQVIHKPGPILEETHYYPFGLTMTGISAKAANKLDNKFEFNGKEKQDKEFSDGSGLEMYDYGARFYDNQLGRWNVADPLSDDAYGESPYNYVGNNPLNYTDPTGMFRFSVAKEYFENNTIDNLYEFAMNIFNLGNYIERFGNENPDVIQEISFSTGLSQDQIYKDLKSGKGPTFILKGLMNGEHQDYKKNTIDLMIEPFLELTKLNKQTDKSTFDVQLFAATTYALHEYAHLGDKKTNKGQNSGQSGWDLSLNNPDLENSSQVNGPQRKKAITGHRGGDVEQKIIYGNIMKKSTNINPTRDSMERNISLYTDDGKITPEMRGIIERSARFKKTKN